MKKTLAVLLAACVLFGAAAAFAQQDVKRPEGHEHRNDHQNMMSCHCQAQPGDEHGGFERHHRFGRWGMNFTPDMPKEIREKAAELAKLRVDLEEAMSSEPVNKAKALDTYAKMQKIEQEIKIWRCSHKLEHIEEFRTQRELNKKFPHERGHMKHNEEETAKPADAHEPEAK